MKNKRFVLSTTQVIMISFFMTILVGSLLLSLPLSWADGKEVNYLDALFTATTSVCVTGLVTVPTFSTWSAFGHVVILLLIQIGGLGIITVMSMIMISLHKKIGISDRMLIQDAFNLSSLSGIVRFVYKVVLGTFIVEGIGAICYMFVFVPEFGLKGIWISIFTSVSAFCNAGIDIISENSLCAYATNPVINIVTCLLIILGGIGYIVWWDVIRVIRNVKRQGRNALKGLTLHSKIALSMTAFLIVLGAMLYFVLEYNNPLTMKSFSLFDKLQLSFFQSVTTRTAGFATLAQQNFTNASAFVSLLLMFIGGSPVGTAGGIKTVTLAVLIITMRSAIKNTNEVNIFNRRLSKQSIVKAVAVAGISFLTMFISTILLSVVTNANAIDIIYETVSATATVGLTRNLTPLLNIWGKLIVIATMYLGRVGPISLVIAFALRKKNENIIKNPTEEISVG